jgi:hypothetical protein
VEEARFHSTKFTKGYYWVMKKVSFNETVGFHPAQCLVASWEMQLWTLYVQQLEVLPNQIQVGIFGLNVKEL